MTVARLQCVVTCCPCRQTREAAKLPRVQPDATRVGGQHTPAVRRCQWFFPLFRFFPVFFQPFFLPMSGRGGRGGATGGSRTVVLAPSKPAAGTLSARFAAIRNLVANNNTAARTDRIVSAQNRTHNARAVRPFPRGFLPVSPLSCFDGNFMPIVTPLAALSPAPGVDHGFPAASPLPLPLVLSGPDVRTLLLSAFTYFVVVAHVWVSLLKLHPLAVFERVSGGQ
jgi:hypothetical protein